MAGMDSPRLVRSLVNLVAAAGVAAAAWTYTLSTRRAADATDADVRSRGGSNASAGDPHIQIDTSDESKAAATGAAVAHVLARPDSIRQRAQNAATISSAVAAALAVAAVAQLARDQNESWRWWTIALVSLALITWIGAVWSFVRVVTHGLADPPKAHDYQALVNAYEEHSNRLRTKLRRAAAWSGAALLLTGVAVLVEIVEQTYAQTREQQIVLTPSGATAVASLCGWDRPSSEAGAPVDVRIATDELAKQVVVLKVLSRPIPPDRSGERFERCAAQSRKMRLPRTAIMATSELDR